MRKRLWCVCAGMLCLAAGIVAANQAQAQTPEVKEKPSLYTYMANWQFARSNWGDVDKMLGPENAVMQKALAAGTIVGYGNDVNLVHQLDTETHVDWWSATSMAGVLKALDQLHTSGDTNSPTLYPSRHWDEIYVSNYYNWKPGTTKGGYTHVSVYQFRPDAPDDALDNLSAHYVAPTLEKLLADGTIAEYEIDTMAIHTQDPGTFLILYVTPTPEGLDKVEAAVQEAVKSSPLATQAFSSYLDDSGHRDGLYKTDCVYK